MSDHSLDDEREVTSQAINDTPPHRSWRFEVDAAAGSYHSEHECVAKARTSDGLVLLLSDSLTRMTKAEYEAAKGAAVPRFIFIRHPKALDPSADSFVTKEQGDSAVTRNFSSNDELRSAVMTSLHDSLIRDRRESIANKRRLRVGSTTRFWGRR